ncbi:MAG: acetyl-CoA carboxylase carboxyltransferase subunit alpha, partial [Pseudomonadota bacterium]
VQVARHTDRPASSEYIAALFSEYTPLAGDRLFQEDHAIIGGLARFHDQACVVMGHEKGKDIPSRMKHNFGMPRPEGYRKAQRLMQLAEQFRLPLFSFIDTPGAYPGKGAEERGQAEAIARAMQIGLGLQVPYIVTIIGEGGSGGAIAIACGDKILMLEHAIYSVISAEGCASILWRDSEHVQQAAQAMRITAQDLQEFGIIDEIIPEPLGGAHRDPKVIFEQLDHRLQAALDSFEGVEPALIASRRADKFMAMGRAHS